MKTLTTIAFLALILAACAPVQANATDVHNTAVAVAGTEVALTQAALPTATPPPTTSTQTPEITFAPATTIPTLVPPPIFTPDAIQVERWREYQTELANALFVYNPAFPQLRYGPDVYQGAICEWDILGLSNQEVYLWAACISADGLSLRTNPAVIYLEPDGSILGVKAASEKIDLPDPYLIYDLHLFPIDIQEKLCLHYFSGYMPQCPEMTSAYIPLDYRQTRESVLVGRLA
jgi:hypothetical protein